MKQVIELVRWAANHQTEIWMVAIAVIIALESIVAALKALAKALTGVADWTATKADNAAIDLFVKFLDKVSAVLTWAHKRIPQVPKNQSDMAPMPRASRPSAASRSTAPEPPAQR